MGKKQHTCTVKCNYTKELTTFLVSNSKTFELPLLVVFTARCTLVQSAVLRSHVVCLPVRPSVCDVGEL